jgi:glycosyltransferase involved in cell wall biosynthesis
MGRHVPQKGFDTLVRAFADCVKEHRIEQDLILAGDGKDHELLKNLASQLGISSRVHFPGRVDHAKAVQLFKGADLFVLPSRHEPFGIVNLEAMAAGIPLIATRVGGVPEFVEDGRNGILVKPDDTGALARAMVRVLGDADLRDRLVREGQQTAARFDWCSIASQYRQVYSRLHPSTAAPIAVTSHSLT